MNACTCSHAYLKSTKTSRRRDSTDKRLASAHIELVKNHLTSFKKTVSLLGDS